MHTEIDHPDHLYANYLWRDGRINAPYNAHHRAPRRLGGCLQVARCLTCGTTG
jgi:hypothetical protein